MSAIDPGAFARRLQFEILVRTPDGQGGFESEWVGQFGVWAAIRPLAASGADAADMRLSVTTHEIVLRRREEIVAGARFRLGDRLFEIEAAYDPDETGRYLSCRCRETR